jgi:hypothetical protein
MRVYIKKKKKKKKEEKKIHIINKINNMKNCVHKIK